MNVVGEAAVGEGIVRRQVVVVVGRSEQRGGTWQGRWN